MSNDIEYELKTRLKELSGDEMAASADEVQKLLDRVKSYRDRIQTKRREWDAEVRPLYKELHRHRRTIGWARQRLDPEGKGTHFSNMDIYETAELIKEIEKRRGKIVAARMIYGCQLTDEYAAETLGVLKAAIDEANREKEKWFNYLNSARAKDGRV